jgi:DNA-binding HxlR family transcriptional regulator
MYGVRRGRDAGYQCPPDNPLPGIEECTCSLRNVIDALYVLSGKWKLPLILSLVQSSKRFNKIQNEVAGITPKVLANELKHLELNGFITPNVYPSTPVTMRMQQLLQD